MKAVVTGMVPPDRRASAFGVFNFGLGVPWFLGSALMGLLYDQSITVLVVFSMSLQFLAVLWLLAVRKRLFGTGALAKTSEAP